MQCLHKSWEPCHASNSINGSSSIFSKKIHDQLVGIQLFATIDTCPFVGQASLKKNKESRTILSKTKKAGQGKLRIIDKVRIILFMYSTGTFPFVVVVVDA